MSLHRVGHPPPTPLLAVRGLTLRVGGHPVVDGVDLDVGAGERVALLGPSGSGKTLTAAAALGRLPAVAVPTGSVALGGTEVLDVPAARRDRAVRVAAVGQDPRTAMNPLVRVRTQLRAAVRVAGGDDSDAALAAELTATGIEDAPRVLAGYPGELSGGQRQRVQLAFALAGRPHLLVADEPTTALDPATRRRVLELLDARLCDAGAALLFISHDTAAARALCSRAVGLAHGRVAAVDELAPGRRAGRRPRPTADRSPTPAAAGDGHAGRGRPLLEASGVWRVHPDPRPRRPWHRDRRPVAAVRGVDLTVRQGERVGVAGPSGAGKTTLLRILLALDHADAGTVAVDGRDVRPGRVRDLRWLRRAVQYVPQDPAAALDPRMTAHELVAEPRHRLDVPGDHDAEVASALDRVGLPTTLVHRRPGELSGGQAQRVALARALAVRPRLLLADEPVSGLDPSLRDQVVELLAGVCADGTALLLVAHDVAVIDALCARTVVLVAGEVVEDRPTAELLADPGHPDVVELVRAADTTEPRECAEAEPVPAAGD